MSVLDATLTMKRRLGEVLVDGDFISPSDLDRALDEQKRTNERLGEVLMRLGVLSDMELKAVLASQADLTDADEVAGVRQRLGDLLLKSKRITSRQLDRALDEQKRTNERLGEVLVRFNLISPFELEAVLALQEDMSNGAMAARFMLGEILVATGTISRKQLETALADQRLTKRQIGEILVDTGMVKPSLISEALKIQSKLVAASLVALLASGTLSGCGLTPVTGSINDGPKQGIVQQFRDSSGILEFRTTQNATKRSATTIYASGAVVVNDVPFFQQNPNDNTCAQAAMSVVLNYWGKDTSYSKVVNESNRFNLPTSPQTVESYLKHNGLTAQPYRQGKLSFLRSLVDQGRPPMVLLQFGNSEHWVVVVGYNQSQKTIIMHDSIDGAFTEMKESDFVGKWQNKMMSGIPVVGGANYEGLIIDIQG
ncbi:bacteriophage N4 adsorption protein B [compost metagenome]